VSENRYTRGLPRWRRALLYVGSTLNAVAIGHQPKAYIITSTALKFHLQDPLAFDIRDVAEALAKIPRFTGHSSPRHWYSVADHCRLVASLLPDHLKFEGLMHDGHEAFVNDIASPAKYVLPDYVRLENRVSRAFRRWYDLPRELSTEVEQADQQACDLERGVAMPYSPHWPMPKILTTAPDTALYFESDDWRQSRRMFLDAFYRFDILRNQTSCN